ncbi:MAG: hypothetical protein HY046_03865, partial [Acidobacteria bacterium]|nr:hypothetical protein [Acidobacteriota bacterium]
MERHLASPHTATAIFGRWWQNLDKPSWRTFFLAIFGLGIGFLLALYSGVAASLGHDWIAGASALSAIGLA